MVDYKFNSAGISAKTLGVPASPLLAIEGLAAGVIGTARKGPAFVPVSFSNFQQFSEKFGDIGNDHFGPLAVFEWLRNATAVTYLRVLGIGDGLTRSLNGEVNNAGFTVGENLPSGTSGFLAPNPYANLGGPPGRTYFLGCFMSESNGSTIFSSAGLQGTGSVNGIVSSAVPIIRGVLMAPSGVILRLSSSGGGQNSLQSSLSYVASDDTAPGTTLGSVTLKDGISHRQDFVLLLNGYNKDVYANTAITASFDVQSPIYFGKVFNTTASLIQERGHYLYSKWDIHPQVAQLTGTGVVSAGADAPTDANRTYGSERSIFLITSSLSRDVGSTTVPNYESFRNRFTHASTPWFISQKFQGKHYDLFKLHALDAGSNVANKYKVVIGNLTPSAQVTEDPKKHAEPDSGYGTFDLYIYPLQSSEDELARPLEVFVGLSLNPASDDYVSKRIGDVNSFYDFDRPLLEQKLVIEGNYPNLSNYVRVEVSADVAEAFVPEVSLPFGFRGISHLVTSGSAPLASLGGIDAAALIDSTYIRNAVTPPLPFRMNNKAASPFSAPSPFKSWGVIFDHVDENTNQILLTGHESLAAFSSYYPDFSTTNINFVVGNNSGYPDTLSNGILDSDRFCRNIFTLENISIVTGSNGYVSPPSNWNLARYVRDGNIAQDEVAKVKRVSLADMVDASTRSYLSFSTIFQGGFNGVNIFDEDEAEINNSAAVADMLDSNRGTLTSPTISAYMKALDILKNPTLADVNILAMPGIREHVLTDAGISAAEDRYDAMFVMDLTNGTSVQNTVELLQDRQINTTFAATYYPDVVIKPFQDSELEITVPPSVVVLGALSKNDAVGPWFAPAGFSRGKLVSTISTTIPLQEPDLDLLYSNDVNPIYAPTNIPQSTDLGGVVVWGQKTLQKSKTSALDRINVRRLLIEVRKIVRNIAIRYLFQPNTTAVGVMLQNEITRRLASLQVSGALEEFRITLNPFNAENSSIGGKIYLRPKNSTVFLPLDFLVSNGLQSEL